MSDAAFITYLVLLGTLVVGVLGFMTSLVWTAHREYMDSRRRTDAEWETLRKRLRGEADA